MATYLSCSHGLGSLPKAKLNSASDMIADKVERGKSAITSSLVGLMADANPTPPAATMKNPPQKPSPESKRRRLTAISLWRYPPGFPPCLVDDRATYISVREKESRKKEIREKRLAFTMCLVKAHFMVQYFPFGYPKRESVLKPTSESELGRLLGVELSSPL